MIQAKLQTTNFEFVAFGQTTSHAKNALLRGLIDHAKQYGLDNDWFSQYEGDIQLIYFKPNCAYRDNELIKGKQ